MNRYNRSAREPRCALNADVLFIEAAFAQADAQLAAELAHLTTNAAGRLARRRDAAGRVVPLLTTL